MHKKFIVSNYSNTISEISKLIESKNNILTSKYVKDQTIVNANFKGIFDYIKYIKSKSTNFLFLDSPYSYINIFFILVSKNFISNLLNIKVKVFLSNRGSLPLKGCRKYTEKIIYWKLLNFINKFFKFSIISSSRYEKETIKKFFKGKVYSIPDISLCDVYFEKNFIKMQEVLNKKINNRKASNNRIKVLVPSRFSHEKGIINLLKLINTPKLNTIDIKSFDFTCNIRDLKIIKGFHIKNKSLINFIGWQNGDDFLKILNQYDVVIIPSLYESFSIAGYQSLLMGKGLIITENSPWNKILKLNGQLPISLCPPLLKDYQIKYLIKKIIYVNSKRKGFTSKEVLDDLILKEAGIKRVKIF